MLRATTACTFSTSEPPEVVRQWCVLYILTWKCASRHNGVHFFDIATSNWSKSGNVPTTACTFSTSQLWSENLYILTSKCASRHNGVHFFDISTSKTAPRPLSFEHILTWKCASCHNGVHFFNISTSKSGPIPSVFKTFYFQMCFAPQRRALFQHLNFQKWSDAEVFCTFSLRNRLRATTASNFSSLISPDVSAPAALASLLFNPPEPQNHKKTQCFATFLPFRAPASSFFWSFLF